MANELRQAWDTALDTVISVASTIATTANTTSADATQFDNSTLNWPYARAVLRVPGLSGAPSAAGQTVDLYMVHDTIDGSINELPIPVASNIEYRSKYMGSFVCGSTQTEYIKAINISLEGVTKGTFFIKNNLSVSLQNSSSGPITVKLLPYTYEPT